jgi:hypothetical protein
MADWWKIFKGYLRVAAISAACGLVYALIRIALEQP